MDTMRAATRCAAVLLAATVLTAAAPPSPAASPLRGFVYTSYSRGGYSAPASAASLREVAAANVRVIELMSTWYVANSVNATAVAPAAQSPSDDDVRAAMRDARAAGLAVALKPHIDSMDGVWRANIGTRFSSEAQWAAFFASYTAYLLHCAALAAAEGGALAGFNVGTELDGTHHREAQWRALIAAVRAALPPGTPLWLGPNWRWADAPGYRLVPFWDALDFLGVDMYAPLANRSDPTPAEAAAGWAPIVADLAAFSAAQGGKGVIFAEMGYASWRNASIDAPGCCSGPPDPATQALLYASFFAAVWPQPWMAGAFWWAWPEDSPNGAPCSTDFSVYRKPAAQVVRAAYAAAGAGGAPPPPPLTVYANGATAWANWSYGAAVDLASAADPYPGHAASAAVAVTASYGALALRAPAPLNLSAYSALELDVRADARTGYALSAWLCACDGCGSCGGAAPLPAAPLDAYAPAGAPPCSVPAAWDGDPAAARLRIPLADLLGGLPPAGAPAIARLQIGADLRGAAFAVDNLRFV